MKTLADYKDELEQTKQALQAALKEIDKLKAERDQTLPIGYVLEDLP